MTVAKTCPYCEDAGPDPGWLYTDNNGPIVSCPVCNPKGDSDRAWELAEWSREQQRQRTR